MVGPERRAGLLHGQGTEAVAAEVAVSAGHLRRPRGPWRGSGQSLPFTTASQDAGHSIRLGGERARAPEAGSSQSAGVSLERSQTRCKVARNAEIAGSLWRTERGFRRAGRGDAAPAPDPRPG